MHIKDLTVSFLISIIAAVGASPIAAEGEFRQVMIPNPQIFDCTSDQQAQIGTAFQQIGGLGAWADGVLTHRDPNLDNGYKHYFSPDDKDMVTAAFKVYLNVVSKVRFNFRCIPEDQCSSGGFAYTDPTPETYEGNGHVAGVREIKVCPLFFTDSRTTRTLPNGLGDKEGIERYCYLKESKKLFDFESGAHTLLHEISHLDAFGIAAGYPEASTDNPFPYTYHGTVDWRNKFDAGNARTLKTSKAANRPYTWQNAESLAAAATEMFAEGYCELTNINL